MIFSSRKALLGCSAAIMALGLATGAMAQQRTFDIPAQDAATAIGQFGLQAQVQISAPIDHLRGVRTPSVTGAQDSRQALRRLIAGTGLEIASDNGSVIVLRVAQRPAATRPAAQDAPVRPRNRPTPPPLAAEPTPEAATVQDIIVTARRMQERIIDVPVAVSAFTAEQLDDRKIEGGSELLRVVPNVSFSKDNFTSYNFSIRGIGSKVLATTADPGVAVSFNNTALLRNRLFEQEYYDVQRLEVLRGPQGTLYGRNATAGVVNMLPNLPKLNDFAMDMQWEVGNHDSRRAKGMINIPVGETLAVRFAAAATQRDGFDFNTVTNRNVNGRDLWGARLGVLWQPTENFRANFLWERFREDDDRARTGKMLCTRAEAPTSVDWIDPSGKARSTPTHAYWSRSSLTPGCAAESLYADEAYGVPNGHGFPIVASLISMAPFNDATAVEGYPDNYLFRQRLDPFAVAGNRQAPDLRTISTAYDPKFQAENDVFQLNLEWRLSPSLTLYSQTLYMEDSYSGFQDFFRTYAIDGHMARKEQLGKQSGKPRIVNPYWTPWLGDSTPTSGVFLDPQLGATDRFMALDLSQAESTQWSQEFRLQSTFDGPFNFNLGANWLKYKTEENYWIFSNVFSLMAVTDNRQYVTSGDFDKNCNLTSQGQGKVDGGKLDKDLCIYIDPTPLAGILNGEGGDGHNYLRNISINETESWAVFGEGYWNVRNDLRLTLGLRYTDDTKTFTPVPSQLLASTTATGAGFVGRGYPRFPDEELNWGEWTGRAAIDWKPDLSFTDDTLVYASYSRGYKGGGANPRDRDYNPKAARYPTYPAAFDPEFINAYEIGMKNMLAGGRVMFNTTAFFYDYEDYQVAQMIDRGIHNENVDAKIWGVEFETAWAPTRNFRLDATLGLLKTRIGDGQTSVDVMDRLQGHDDWVAMRPWPTSPATCIVPKDVLGRFMQRADYTAPGRPQEKPNEIGNAFIKYLCPGPTTGFAPGGQFSSVPWDAWGPLVYDSITDAPNEGRGFAADLSGNELPNAPRVTFNVGAQYRIELPQGWDVTVRGDYYRQSDSWMRVYNNAPYDRLKGWDNANVSVTLSNSTSDLMVQVYVKNVFDDTPITDGFTGPDELGNFTNVFTLDPRIIGVSVRKSF